MVREELKRNLSSVAFTIPTPFTSGGESVDTEALRSNVDFLVDHGAKTVIPCGNTGEYYSLTDAERVEVVRETVEAFDSNGSVIGGVGGSTETARTLAKQYRDAGADAIMVMNPSHTYIHDKGLVEYYRAVADATDLGVILYKRSEVVSDAVLKELAHHENVVGVKYALNDIKAFSKICSESDADVVWMTGIAERFAPAFALEGASGFTTGIGNFLPSETLALQNAIASGDFTTARAIRDLLRPLEELREESGEDNRLSAANNVPVVKHGMELAGLTGGPVREPLVGLSKRDRKRTADLYTNIKDKSITSEGYGEL